MKGKEVLYVNNIQGWSYSEDCGQPFDEFSGDSIRSLYC